MTQSINKINSGVDAKLQDIEADFNQVQIKFRRSLDDTKRVTIEMGKLHDRFESLEGTYTTMERHNLLRERVEDMASLENINYLNNVYLPKIIEEGKKIDEFLQQIEHIKEVVQHYDEVLCVKANRSEFKLAREEIQMNYISTKKW